MDPEIQERIIFLQEKKASMKNELKELLTTSSKYDEDDILSRVIESTDKPVIISRLKEQIQACESEIISLGNQFCEHPIYVHFKGVEGNRDFTKREYICTCLECKLSYGISEEDAKSGKKRIIVVRHPMTLEMVGSIYEKGKARYYPNFDRIKDYMDLAIPVKRSELKNNPRSNLKR